jgi:hypothetical protein
VTLFLVLTIVYSIASQSHELYYSEVVMHLLFHPVNFDFVYCFQLPLVFYGLTVSFRSYISVFAIPNSPCTIERHTGIVLTPRPRSYSFHQALIQVYRYFFTIFYDMKRCSHKKLLAPNYLVKISHAFENAYNCVSSQFSSQF